MSYLTRRNPIREMVDMQRTMDRIFDDAWRSFQPAANTLPLDVHESESGYAVLASLPGLAADDIDLNFHDGALTIGAELAEPEINEGVRVLLQERGYGKVSRTITLGQPVDAEKIEARYENGVLMLSIPKAEGSQPKRISINKS